ncbi:PTS sugar transporter subunit IIA [Sporolactobacillus shoreicorticis]|nr:PTS sugar transporter subunit IIA [Sporolactobacillus shoreicorticis]
MKDQYTIDLTKKRGTGVRLAASQEEKLRILNAVSLSHIFDEGSIIERRESIIKILLKNESATNFRALANLFFVSVSSITMDMKEIENWLKSFDVLLVKNKHGTSITGTETDVRKAMIALLQQRIERLTGSAGIHDINDQTNREKVQETLSFLISADNIHRAKDLILFLELQLNCKFNEFYYVNMLISSAVILQRLAEGKLCNRCFEEKKGMRNLHVLKTYIAAKEALEKFSRLKVSEEDVQFLNQYIMGTGIDEQIGTGNTKKYNSDIKRLARKICHSAGEALQIDFSNDSILYQGLLVHLEPMVHRLKNVIVIKNPLLDQIKKQYSALFGLACLLGSLIENETHLKINENEIGFIMVHFQAAIERNKSLTKVIVVCPGGIGTSELVANKIKRILPNIKIVGVFSIGTLSAVDLDTVDFIVSTVPLTKVKKKVIIVSPMVDLMDAKAINSYYLENIYKKHSELSRFKNLLSVIHEDTVFIHKDIKDKLKMIHYISEQLVQRGYVTSEFQHSIEEREKIASTDLGNGVAIPHGHGSDVNQSTIAVATVRHPITWGKNKVKLIFFIAICDDSKHEIRGIMSDLYSLFESEALIKKLSDSKTVSQLIQLLSQPQDK